MKIPILGVDFRLELSILGVDFGVNFAIFGGGVWGETSEFLG